MNGRVFLTVAEPSGEALAVELVHALRTRRPDIAFAGVGGPALQAAGVDCAFAAEGLQTIGLVDGLRVMKHATALAGQAAEAARAFRPDVSVLVDAWGFSLRVAQALRAQGVPGKIVKYVGPQVWATRPGRARQLSALIDGLLCIFEMEVPYYTPFGVPCTVVGHPAVARTEAGDGASFRARHGLGPETPLLLVLFGSRPREVRRIAPDFEATVRAVQAANPGVRVATVISTEVAEQVAARQPQWGFTAIEASTPEKSDAFAAADVALCVSGTVTTEVALQGTPVVVGYRVDPLTWAVARGGLMRTRFITLMNVVADHEVAPEFEQFQCTAKHLAPVVGNLLARPEARATQIAAQFAALDRMGRGQPSASERAADALLAYLPT
jgi:lipid-A-disaccharide synthase